MKSLSVSSWSRLAAAFGAPLGLLILSGCQTYDRKTADFSDATKAGSVSVALAEIEKRAEASKGSKDEIIWRLEQGASLRSAALASLPPPPVPAPKAGEPAPVPPTLDEVHAMYFKRSNVAFDEAEARVETYDEQAKVKLGSELGSAFTNLAQLPYRGRAYDRIMANTYKSLNYLQLGERDRARVELNRSLQRQRDAVADNERRIAESQALADQSKGGTLKDEKGEAASSYDVGEAQKDPKTGPAIDATLAAAVSRMKPYGDYVNPYSVFLDGLFFTVLGENGSDWERGRKSFERVAGMVPENPYLKADAALARDAADGKTPTGITYVIFETGAAPNREEVRIDIPTIIVSDRLPYVGAAFPRLRFNDDYVSSLSVVVGGQAFATAPIASMDSIIANEFKNEWPTIVTKTILTAVTKAVTQSAVQKELDDRAGAIGSLLGKVALTVANIGTTIADTRTWTSLPKEFQYARVQTPADRQITLQAGGLTQTITLLPAAVNVVYAKSASSHSPLYVSQFTLR